MKGEENTVMKDYVLPDFSSIKKGFCKVRKHLLAFEWLLWSECLPPGGVFNELFFLSAKQPLEEMVFSGKYKTGEQILRLANERFAVPEMLFHPADIGIQELGIPEAIVDSIQSLPEGQSTSCRSCFTFQQ